MSITSKVIKNTEFAGGVEPRELESVVHAQ